MNFRPSLFISAVALALTSLGANRLMAANVIVGACPGSSYATISAAVAASLAGSTIRICPGADPEQVVIKKPLTLVGITIAGSQNPVVQAPAGGVVANTTQLYNISPPIHSPVAAQILVMDTASVNISNIAVDGAKNGIASCALDVVGIYYRNASGAIANVVVKNQALATALNGCQSGEGIYIESGYGTSGQSVVEVAGSSVHGYQKNGITADGSNTNVEVQNNFVTGQGPTTGAAENGIQFSDGAFGSIKGNTVLDNIYSGPTYGASGILIYSAQGAVITNNSIGSSQLPIATVSDPSFPTAHNPNGTSDRTTINNNEITNTAYGDGIDACSNSNTINGNLIVNALTSGIHLDSLCGGTGKNNTVSSNVVNESCAGILQGGSPNSISSNTSFNVQSAILAGDACVSSRASINSTAALGTAATVQLLPSRR